MKVTDITPQRPPSGVVGTGSPAGGDLSGGYPAPSVTGLQGFPVCTDTPATDDVLTWDGAQWCPAPLPAAPVTLPPSGPAGGDLAGTYPNPTVAKLAGVAATGIPSTGYVLTATSPTAASWQAPAAATTGGAHVHVNNVLYSGDGVAVAYVLPVAPVDALSVSVYVAGARTQDWALSGVLRDVLTFGAAPAAGTDNIAVDIVAAV